MNSTRSNITQMNTPEWYVTEYPVEGSFAITDGYEIFAQIIGGKTVGDECDLASRIAKLPNLERERDDYMERCRTALSERDSWRMRAEQKYAMRRELEELLGVDQKDASDEQFKKGLDAIKNIISERDEAREDLENMQEQRDLALKVIKRLERERDEALHKLELCMAANSDVARIARERDEARFLLKAAQSALDAIHLEVGGWIKTMKENTD